MGYDKKLESFREEVEELDEGTGKDAPVKKAWKERTLKKISEMEAPTKAEYAQFLDTALGELDEVLGPNKSRKRREEKTPRAAEQAKVAERLRLLEDVSEDIGKEVATATTVAAKIARGFTTSPLHIKVAMGAVLAWCAYDFVRAVNAYKASKAEKDLESIPL